MTNLEKRDIELIVIDIDGTLLNSKHELSDRNQEVIKKAADQGVKVVLATGKTRTSAEAVIKKLAIETPGVYVQGLMLYNADGTVRTQSTLDANIARRVIQYAADNGYSVVAYSGNRLLTRRNEPPVSELVKYHEPEPESVGPLVNIISHTPVHKLMIFGKDSRSLAKIRWQLNQQVGDSVSFTTTAMLNSLEVLPKGASKGNGVRALLKLLDVEPSKVMAIGDAENDISLLEMVGLGVAVGNAADAVKEIADAVVGSCDADGVAEAIERFVLKSEVKAADTETASDDGATEANEKAASDGNNDA